MSRAVVGEARARARVLIQKMSPERCARILACEFFMGFYAKRGNVFASYYEDEKEKVHKLV